MGNVIGIDLGTTYSCVAIMDGDAPRVIPNLDGYSTTPSVVSFTGSGEGLIGNLALRQAVTNPERTITAVKRLMGKKLSSEELKWAEEKLPYGLSQSENGDVVITIGEREISPQEISSMILHYLRESAEKFTGDTITEAVITVPAHFNDHQRQATKDAAKIAGLNVLRVINEPTAASLAYGVNHSQNAKIVVYDMGGGTLDVTILELNEGVFHVLSTNGDTYLGGEDFDFRILDWLVNKFKEESQVDITQDKLALQRIKEAVEKTKRELSFKEETEISLPFIFSDSTGSKHIKSVITRDQLNMMTLDLVDRSFHFLEQALSDAKLEPDEVDQVILVGGQTRMPLNRTKVAEYFKRTPDESVNPDEAVAMGAALQGGILSGTAANKLILLDVTPLSLGIETENEKFEKIIERNTTIPVRESKSFTTVEHNQSRVRIHVLQGESTNAPENTSLAVFNLIGIPPQPFGVPQIDVTFEIDADGIVKVSAKDVASDNKQSVEVKSSSGLTHEEIEYLVKQALEKASNTEGENAQQ